MTIITGIAYMILSCSGGVLSVLAVEIVSFKFAMQNFGTGLLFSGAGGAVSSILQDFMEKYGAVAGLFFLTFCMPLLQLEL